MLSIIGLVALSPRTAAAQPAHLVWAEELLENLSPANNTYESNPNYITWPGVDGAADYSNHTLCNGFVINLLKQAYELTSSDIKVWFNSTSPKASLIHDTIVAGNGFDVIETVDEIEAGDIIAISYPAGSSSSGHVGVVQGPAELRVSSSPFVEGTYQFEIVIMDSTSSGHGTLDTRRDENGTFQPGAGMGIMRLYADGDLNIVGHTWSTYWGSTYRPQTTHHTVIGRVQ